MFRILLVYLVMILSCFEARAYWEKTNSPAGGFTNDVEFIGETLYCAAHLGLYKSTNQGKSWISEDTLFENSRVVFIRGIEDYIFVGTSGDGLFRSSDNGVSWDNISSNFIIQTAESITSINNSIVVISAGTAYTSNDFGNTWTKPLLKQKRISSMVLHDNYLYAAVINDNQILRKKYDSTDWDTGWELIIANYYSYADTIYEISSNGIDLYIATNKGVYISSDNGNNWHPINSNLGTILILKVLFWDEYIFAISNGKGIFLSNDMGENWSEINNGLTSLRIRDLLIKGKILYTATSHGVFVSADLGNNWKSINDDLKIPSINSIHYNNETLYLGLANQGIYMSSDYGSNWENMNSNELNVLTIENILFGNQVMYAIASYYSDFPFLKIFKSPIDEINWTESLHLMGYFGSSILLENDNILLTVSHPYSQNTFIITNEGMHSEALNLDFRVGAQYFVNNRIIIADNNDGGLYYSEDNGRNWENINPDYNHLKFLNIKEFNQTLYAICSFRDELNQLDKRGIYTSDDYGFDWQILCELPVELESSSYTPLFFLVDEDNIFVVETKFPSVYSASTSKVFLSKDKGVNWDDVSAGLYSKAIKSMIQINDLIYLGTSSGLYKASLKDFGIYVSVTENEIEQKNYLYTYPPYPVPARSEVRAKIYFDSSTEISVENMAVYDIYGRKLPTKESLRLEQETFYSGNIIWDCAGVEPGVYIIRINHGTEVRAVKVMVGI